LAAIPGYEDHVYGITVGNEGFYRFPQSNSDSYNGSPRAEWIADAKTTRPNILIDTVDTFNSYVDGLADDAVRAELDLLQVVRPSSLLKSEAHTS
jgi:hypothetical protein